MSTTKPSQYFDYFIILDFEATCDDKVKLKPQEIIEFPSVLLNAKTGEVEDEFQQYVKPRYHPILTKFCTELTGIQQEWVDAGQDFEKTLELYKQWLTSHGLLDGEKKFAFITCGDWDLKTMLPIQCKTYKLTRPSYFNQWINVKQAFYQCYNHTVRGMTDMLQFLRLRLEGRHHSGIDDCRNITSIVKRMLEDNFVFQITGSLSTFSTKSTA